MRILLSVLMTVAVYAIDVQKLLDEKAYFKLQQEMEMLKTHETIDEFPIGEIESGHQVLLTNDYHLRQLWEFDGESWNAWENETLNIILNKPQELITPPKPDVAALPSDGLLKIAHFSTSSLKEIQERINSYLKENGIDHDRLVVLQFFPESSGISAILTHWR